MNHWMLCQHVLRHYAHSVGVVSSFTDVFLNTMEQHLNLVARAGGLFVDRKTGARWGGRYRRTRCVLYRGYPYHQRYDDGIGLAPQEDVNEVTERFMTGLSSAGLQVRRCSGEDMYRWMMPWFNPKPAACEDGYQLLRDLPYPSDQDQPGHLPMVEDIGAACLKSAPTSDDERKGIWWLQGVAHRVISIERLFHCPRIGHWTLENREDENNAVLFDQMPEGAHPGHDHCHSTPGPYGPRHRIRQTRRGRSVSQCALSRARW